VPAQEVFHRTHDRLRDGARRVAEVDIEVIDAPVGDDRSVA
jgi:hypothetical protein